MQETILKTEHIFKGRVIQLVVHDVALPDGSESKRELVVHPGAVALIALDETGAVLMVKQFRVGAGKVLLEIPAGTLEPSEPVETCAIRELQEETGYRPGKIESLGGFYMAPGYTTEFIHLFLATELVESRLAGDSDEFIELERVPLVEALAMIERGEIADSKSIAGLLRVARRLGV